MSKAEYMSSLQNALKGFDTELVQEIVTDYEERFHIGMEQGRSEEEIIAQLGSVEELVAELCELQPNADLKAAEPKAATTEFAVLTIGQTNKREEREEDTEQSFGKQSAGAEESAGCQQTVDEDTENCENSDESWKKVEESFQKMADKFKDMGRKFEQKNGSYEQSGESFAESLNDMVKSVGKVVNMAMREAGKALDVAAEEIGSQFDKAKKQYYTYRSDDGHFHYNSNERDNYEEPNMEQTVCGEAGCKRVVLNTAFANVRIEPTDGEVPEASCYYFSHKTALVYPFYAYQEGDTFYVGIKKAQEVSQKSGFFQFNSAPSVDIELRLPENVQFVEIKATSGDITVEEISAELKVQTASGDVTVEELSAELEIKAISGDMDIRAIQAEQIILETASGDIHIEAAQGNVQIKTISGDMELYDLTSDKILLQSSSGDITMEDAGGNQVRVKTISGECEITEFDIKQLSINSTSGDISIRDGNAEELSSVSTSGECTISNCDAKEISLTTTSGSILCEDTQADRVQVTSNSGEINLESMQGDMNIQAASNSGDINIEILEAVGTYNINANTMAGEGVVNGNGHICFDGTGVCTISTTSMSGDIHVDIN